MMNRSVGMGLGLTAAVIGLIIFLWRQYAHVLNTALSY
ncbi:MAG: hypothetical protein JWQ02_3464 [Capsulimonas sp.]|jgi:hypothetical protein|nr:hypothetical protein [Capsulimonas sp.]